MAHKVGTQHALGRQEGLHTLELRRKGTPHWLLHHWTVDLSRKTSVLHQTVKFAPKMSLRVCFRKILWGLSVGFLLSSLPSFEYRFFFSFYKVAPYGCLPSVHFFSGSDLPLSSHISLKMEPPQNSLAQDFNPGLICGLCRLINWHHVSAGAWGGRGGRCASPELSHWSQWAPGDRGISQLSRGVPNNMQVAVFVLVWVAEAGEMLSLTLSSRSIFPLRQPHQ